MRVDRSKLGAELKVTLRAHEIHNNWQHRIITVEEVSEPLAQLMACILTV